MTLPQFCRNINSVSLSTDAARPAEFMQHVLLLFQISSIRTVLLLFEVQILLTECLTKGVQVPFEEVCVFIQGGMGKKLNAGKNKRFSCLENIRT